MIDFKELLKKEEVVCPLSGLNVPVIQLNKILPDHTKGSTKSINFNTVALESLGLPTTITKLNKPQIAFMCVDNTIYILEQKYSEGFKNLKKSEITTASKTNNSPAYDIIVGRFELDETKDNFILCTSEEARNLKGEEFKVLVMQTASTDLDDFIEAEEIEVESAIENVLEETGDTFNEGLSNTEDDFENQIL